MSKAAFVLLLASLSACMTPYVLRPGDLAPIVAQVGSEQRVAIWQRAITVLLDEGYVPQVLNEAACYVSGKQRDDVTEGALAGTIAIVTVSPEGRLRVEVGGHGVYRDEADLKRDVAEIQQRLTQEIMGSALPPATPGSGPRT
jgi:hypothetical protein